MRSTEIAYLILTPLLLIVPRVLQRFLIPAPLACLALGLLAAVLLNNEFQHPALLHWMATLGVSTLFLFAGLEVDVSSLRRGWGLLALHLLLRLLTLGAISWAGRYFFDLSWPVACLVALALLTPSTGFILETLGRLGLNEDERYWVTNKAIGGELLALIVLFFVLQADSFERLLTSSAILLTLIVALPLIFFALGRFVVKFAPGSEFSLLVMVGLLAAYVTEELGVEYLVGAFLTGMTARLLRGRLPGFASKENMHAVQRFASFFVPFYFFYRGLGLPFEVLGWSALGIGLAMLVIVLPLRIGSLWGQRRLVMKEDRQSSLRVAVALMPTLIFALVLAGILKERFGISDALYGALLIYATITTILPSLVLAKPFDLDATHTDDEADENRVALPNKRE